MILPPLSVTQDYAHVAPISLACIASVYGNACYAGYNLLSRPVSTLKPLFEGYMGSAYKITTKNLTSPPRGGRNI